MNNLVVIEKNGILVVDSREVAKILEIRHGNLVRNIENYVVSLENSENSKLSSQEFFMESTYVTDGNNKEYKNYLLTKKGCELVAHKRTGKDGIIFTALYIEKFHLMEEILKKPMTIEDMIITLATETKVIKGDITDIKDKLNNQMTIDSGQQNKIKNSVGRRVYERSEQTGLEKKILFSALHRDLRNTFGVPSYRDIKIMDFENAVSYIRAWIEKAEIRNNS